MARTLIEGGQLNGQNDQILMGSTLTSSLIFINYYDSKGTVWPQELKKLQFNTSVENPGCKQAIENMLTDFQV